MAPVPYLAGMLWESSAGGSGRSGSSVSCRQAVCCAGRLKDTMGVVRATPTAGLAVWGGGARAYLISLFFPPPLSKTPTKGTDWEQTKHRNSTFRCLLCGRSRDLGRICDMLGPSQTVSLGGGGTDLLTYRVLGLLGGRRAGGMGQCSRTLQSAGREIGTGTPRSASPPALNPPSTLYFFPSLQHSLRQPCLEEPCVNPSLVCSIENREHPFGYKQWDEGPAQAKVSPRAPSAHTAQHDE